MYTADLQVHIKSTGYSRSILMKAERNLIWIGVSGDVFSLMQKKLSVFKKKIRKGQCGWRIVSRRGRGETRLEGHRGQVRDFCTFFPQEERKANLEIKRRKLDNPTWVLQRTFWQNVENGLERSRSDGWEDLHEAPEEVQVKE